MTSPQSIRGRWSLALTGKLAQFNLSLLLILLAIVALLWITAQNPDIAIRRGGACVCIPLLIATVWGAIHFYGKQEARPADGVSSSVEVHGMSGQKLVVRNPPDRFLMEPQTQALMRSLLLGYDSNLCPDGKVVGNVADEKYVEYTETERDSFIKRHREEVRGKKQQASMLLGEQCDSE